MTGTRIRKPALRAHCTERRSASSNAMGQARAAPASGSALAQTAEASPGAPCREGGHRLCRRCRLRGGPIVPPATDSPVSRAGSTLRRRRCRDRSQRSTLGCHGRRCGARRSTGSDPLVERRRASAGLRPLQSAGHGRVRRARPDRRTRRRPASPAKPRDGWRVKGRQLVSRRSASSPNQSRCRAAPGRLRAARWAVCGPALARNDVRGSTRRASAPHRRLAFVR